MCRGGLYWIYYYAHGSRKMITFLLILLILFTDGTICIGELTEKGGSAANMGMYKQSYQVNRYSIFMTGANFIKIRVRDIATGKLLSMIVDNNDLASFLASERGLETDNFGRFVDSKAYINFREGEYVTQMTRNEGRVIEISLPNFEKFIAKSALGEKARKDVKEYIYEHHILIFEKPLTFEELNVRNEAELLDKYFELNASTKILVLKPTYLEEYNLNASFIALLIDLGYLVGHMDVAPVLFIRK
jgi:hypothetical protein